MKLKKASAAYPARKDKPAAVKLTPVADPPTAVVEAAEGAKNNPTAKPATAPIGKLVIISNRSRGASCESLILSCSARKVATKVPRRPNIMGKINALKTDSTEAIASVSVLLVCGLLAAAIGSKLRPTNLDAGQHRENHHRFTPRH